MRTKEIEQPIDGGPSKPPHIHRAIGRRPIMAAGNSDGDIYMLEYAQGQQGVTLRLLVHNDDAEASTPATAARRRRCNRRRRRAGSSSA